MLNYTIDPDTGHVQWSAMLSIAQYDAIFNPPQTKVDELIHGMRLVVREDMPPGVMVLADPAYISPDAAVSLAQRLYRSR